MHELALARAISDVAGRHAAGRPVHAVNVRVGALRQVVAPTLEFYFGVVAAGGPCDRAELRQELVPARLECRACQVEWELREVEFRCPTCGTAGDVVAGEELEVESIEVAEEDGCTARR